MKKEDSFALGKALFLSAIFYIIVSSWFAEPPYDQEIPLVATLGFGMKVIWDEIKGEGLTDDE